MGSQPILRYCHRRRPSFLQVAWLTSATLIWLCAPAGISNASAAAFVQVSAATPQTSQSQVSVTYTNAQGAGDTNILAIGWRNLTSSITSVIDSAGNTYNIAGSMVSGSNFDLRQAIYYAKNIKAAAAGANKVTVTFNVAAPFVDIRATEYSGLDPANPLDVVGSAQATSATPNSGSVTTTVAQELVFGAGMTAGKFTAAGTNFTSRIITTLRSNIAEDMFVTATGSYSATAQLIGSVSANWVMQVAAFRNAGQLPTGIDVVTQHYDVQRTGWNSRETVLTASNVKSGSFGLLHSVAVGDRVDAQPLVLSNQPISGVSGNRTVVYVATEGNTIYAIDASSGAVLRSKNFGTPVPSSAVGNCNSTAISGITATPVIDRAAGRLYIMIYTSDSGVPTYRLHAVSLTTLADAVPPVVVTASHALTDGTTYNFQASKMRQRAGLLEANGNIYVAFTSFCDFYQNVSRGWVLGWNMSTLTPLAASHLDNSLAPSATNKFFLSTIWMSGNGLAASADGGVFFATGNSNNGSYDSVNNLSESVVKLSSDLTKVTDFFTPSNVNHMSDSDLSAGGVLLIPTQSGPIPNLAVALGKDGRMFFMNQQNLGKFTPGGPDKVLGTFPITQCWCAESYYKGSDGVGRVVSSGGNTIISWKLQTSPSVTLVRERTLSALVTGQDPGFFTSVSSNGTQSGTAVIWAVSRPTDTSPANVLLYAFDAASGSLLFSATAGTWPNSGNANIVPVVANGQVFVASNQQLAIFGPKAAGAAVATLAPASSGTTTSQISALGNQLSGWIDQINGTELMIRKRNGDHAMIDAKPARDAFQSVPIGMEEAITAEGNYDAQGVLHAQTIVRAKDSRDLWPPDQ
jgi:hypothetical protein